MGSSDDDISAEVDNIEEAQESSSGADESGPAGPTGEVVSGGPIANLDSLFENLSSSNILNATLYQANDTLYYINIPYELPETAWNQTPADIE